MKKAKNIYLLGAVLAVGIIVGGILIAGQLRGEDLATIAKLKAELHGKEEILEVYRQVISNSPSSKEELEELESQLGPLLDERNADAKQLGSELAQPQSRNEKISFSDSHNAVTVEILSILIGDKLVNQSKLYGFALDDIREQGKYAIYFEVKITNNKFDGELSIDHNKFKIESTSGDTFSSELTRDWVRGEIHQGRSVRGGLAFALYPDSIPKVLRFDTGLQDGLGSPLEAVSPDLQSLMPKK